MKRKVDVAKGTRIKGVKDIKSLKKIYEDEFPDPVMRLAEKELKGGSKQPNLDTVYEKMNLLKPPFSMSVMSVLPDLDPYLAGAVDAIATNVSACDMEIKWTGEGDGKSEEKKKLTEFFFESSDPTDPMSLNEKVKACALDFIILGSWNLELIKGGEKLVDLVHAPAEFIRVKKKKTGYIMAKNNEKVEFANYGEKEPGDKHQILRAINKFPGYRVYGKPLVKALVVTMLINSLRDEKNLSWFDQGALADLLILIEEVIPPESKKQIIADYSNTGDGEEAMYILSGVGKNSVEQIKRDLEGKSLEALEGNNRQRVLSALRVPPAKVAIYEDANRANTLTQDEVFRNEVIEPIQKMFMTRFNHLIKHGFEYENWEFIMKPISLKDRFQEAKIDDIYSKAGVFNVNDIRAKLNLPTVEGGDRRVVNTPLGLVDLGTWEIAIAQGLPPEAANRLARIEAYNFIGQLMDIRKEIQKRTDNDIDKTRAAS